MPWYLRLRARRPVLPVCGQQPRRWQKAAADLLRPAASRGEPTVVLVTSSGPRADATSEHLIDNFEDGRDDIDVALTQLDGLNAVVHVRPFLMILSRTTSCRATLGRGQFMSSEDAEGLAEGLDDVARDIKLQVVE